MNNAPRPTASRQPRIWIAQRAIKALALRGLLPQQPLRHHTGILALQHGAAANVPPVRVGDRQDLAIDGEPPLGDLAGIVIILALADLNTDVGFDDRGLWLFPGLLLLDLVLRVRRAATAGRPNGRILP